MKNIFAIGPILNINVDPLMSHGNLHQILHSYV